MSIYNKPSKCLRNDATYTSEIKSRIYTRKWHSKRIRLFLPANWTLIYGKLVKYYIWSLAFYGAETWTLRKVDQNSLESF
jgi:hypothetical protein